MKVIYIMKVAYLTASTILESKLHKEKTFKYLQLYQCLEVSFYRGKSYSG